jgi:hypothetical protein
MSTLALTERFAIHSDGISAGAIDGEVIIVNLKSGIYYSLTALGAEIWAHLQDRVSLGEIVDRILQRYTADRTKVCEWVRAFVTELEAETLVVRAATQPAEALAQPAAAAIATEPLAMISAPVLMKYTDLRQIVLLSAAAYDDLSEFDHPKW